MKRLLAAGALLLPSFVLLISPASALAAGFAKDPLFLSKSPVTEGQSVHLYAVISNTDSAAFVGTMVFYDNDARIGSSNVNLAAGAAQTASVLWTPTAGTHAITAKLVATGGSVESQVSQNFTVNAKPTPVVKPVATNTDTQSFAPIAQSAATIDSSEAIQKDISNVSPQVANATAPAFNAIDSARSSFANLLDGQIATTKQKVSATPKPGIVEGASTEATLKDAQIQNGATGAWYWAYTIYLWLLQGVRWLVGNAAVFYPVLALAFLYFIYRMYRRFRRPAY